VGYITTEFGYRLPGAIDSAGDTFDSIPAGFASLSAMPAAGLVQILTFIGLLEITWWKQDPNSFPGDFGASSFPVGFISKKYSEAQKLDYRAKELNQGRAAQMGILALMVHEQLGVDILPPH
jgi:Chlorophyll A-B binding protein